MAERQPARSIVVTGANRPLGRRVAEALRGKPFVKRVVGIEPAPSSEWLDGVELVPLESDPRELVALLQQFGTDTVVHCALADDRSGTAVTPSGANVIQTMRLGAAVGDAKVSVRSWIVASSSDVYPASSHAPLLYREDAATECEDDSRESSLLEAEEYARDVAEHALHLNVCILRLAPIVGPGFRSPFGSLLAQSPLPAPLGFDPPLQLLHVDDAVDALCFAVERELAGVYNVASSGVYRWSEVASELGRRTLPIPPVSSWLLATLLRTLGLPHIPEGLVDRLRFGHAVDTAKLASAGFVPRMDQRACLRTSSA